MTFEIEEFKALVKHFDFGHPLRIAFLLMGFHGLRSQEVCNIKLDDFSNECKYLRYVVAKPKVKQYVTGTTRITHNIRDVELCESLRKEVLFYIENNYHIFKDRLIFGFSKDSLRRYLAKLRKSAIDDKIKDPILKNLLLDQETQRYGFGVNVQPCYRFTLHSFRRFYLTFSYHVIHEKDIIDTQLEIGHSLKETTQIYIKRNKDIGLTPDLINKKINFESLIYESNQSTLNEFAA